MLKKKRCIILILLIGLILLVPSSGVWADDKSILPSMTIVGEGRVSTKPDQGEINIGVVTQRQAAVDAMRDNSAALGKVFQRLTELGIAAKDVETNNLNLNPVYARRDKTRDPPAIIGYEVTNQVRITVRDLMKMGNVLDAVVREGVNRLNGVSFDVAESAKFLDEARRMAIRDARRKAELYAAASGVKVGPVLAVQEAPPHLPRPQQFRLAQVAESVPIAPGQLEFRVRITVIYRIETGDKK